tara:strand:- start:847 stop:1308 length:462 start_codon:yes stop_codon:yes gene_type:complete
LTNDYKIYANFNSFVVDCRIFYAEIVTRKNGDRFLAITAITNCLNDDEGMTITFNNSNGLMSLFEKGFLPIGRQITVTGHIASVRETYTDAESGEVRMLKRPELHLVDAGIPTGGLGAMPKDETVSVRKVGTVVRPSDAAKQSAPAVEQAPAF